MPTVRETMPTPISIHVLRVEDDYRRSGMSKRDYISIHVLRVEDDLLLFIYPDSSRRFQSTSSVWRTTASGCTPGLIVAISIHVLRVEDDPSRP